MNRFPSPMILIAVLLASMCAATAASADYYDPPGRVARLSDSRGGLSYSPAGENGWYDLQRNRPLGRGDRLWTDPGSRAEFEVGSAEVRLDQDTGLDILELNDRLVQLQLSQGSINLRVRRLYAGQEFEIATPSLAFVIDRPGNYRIDVDRRGDRATLVVWQGAGVAYGNGDRFPLRAGDAVDFYGNDLRDYEEFALPRADDFDRYCAYRDNRLDRSQSLRYLGDDVIGYSELDDYGDWRSEPSYGNVWFPRQVDANWAPYHDGRWIWQEPWGWTWVDAAPWGFAPSHYGRWARMSGRWGWIPGPRNSRPVYAPALVVFIGSHGWSNSLAQGGDNSIGWFPLGPSDPYLPPYRASRDYFSRVNVSNTVINNIAINNVYNDFASGSIDVGRTRYANRGVANAVTAVPARVFVNSQPVRPSAVRLDRETLDKGEMARLAPIAPRLRSVLGTDTSAKARPPRENPNRPMFVRTPPPAVEQPFIAREKLLQNKPGRPLEANPETRPGARPEINPRRNLQVIPNQASMVDARTAGPRRGDGTKPPHPTQKQPLDRSSEDRRGPPVRGAQDRHEGQNAAPPTIVPPPNANAAADAQAKARANAQARADAQAKAQADRADAQAKAQAHADAQARVDQQAKAQADRADAQAKAQARADAQTKAQADRTDAQAKAQARADAQAHADQQAKAQADRADAQAKAQADRADAQAKAQARADQQATPPAEPRQAAPAKHEIQKAQQQAARNPPNCLMPAEVDALQQRSARKHVEVPAYVACDAQQN